GSMAHAWKTCPPDTRFNEVRRLMLPVRATQLRRATPPPRPCVRARNARTHRGHLRHGQERLPLLLRWNPRQPSVTADQRCIARRSAVTPTPLHSAGRIGCTEPLLDEVIEKESNDRQPSCLHAQC